MYRARLYLLEPVLGDTKLFSEQKALKILLAGVNQRTIVSVVIFLFSTIKIQANIIYCV